MTSRRFQVRFSEHLGYIKSECSESSREHFTLSDIEGMVLEQVRNNNPYILRAREELLIQKFDSYKYGLNKERLLATLASTNCSPYFLLSPEVCIKTIVLLIILLSDHELSIV